MHESSFIRGYQGYDCSIACVCVVLLLPAKITTIGHVYDCAKFWNPQTHSVNDSMSDFDSVFLETPVVKNCIVGMLLTCPI